MCRDTGHFMRDCPHCEAFRAWHKEHLNSWGRARKKDACPKDQCLELMTKVISYQGVALALETGPMTRWVGPEMLVDVMLEGCEVLALADSGSQVNTMTPELVQEQGYPVLPLDGLVNYPLDLVGLGG